MEGERPCAPDELPVLGARRPERADAARNRAKVLATARRLFAARGVEKVTIAQIARAAGVGKGTVFHRFGSRAGLVRALLDERERDLQEAILRGPPPLGPGAGAADRLAAFLEALLDLTLEHADLLIEADGGAGGRYRTGAYAAWHRHVAVLVAEIGGGGDADLIAHLVLAPLAPDFVRHLVREVGVDDAALRGLLLPHGERGWKNWLG
jgi:AcrR family transcriptional regulator